MANPHRPIPSALASRNGKYGVPPTASVKHAPPTKPADLPPEAGQLWDEVCGMLPAESLAAVDAAALSVCCRWYAVLQDNLAKIEAGDSDPYKLTCLAAVASKQFATYSAKFGLTPADREKLTLPKPQKAGVESRNRYA